MLNTIVFIIIAEASFIFITLVLGGGMVYVPVLNSAGFDIVKVTSPLVLLLNGLNTLLVITVTMAYAAITYKANAGESVSSEDHYHTSKLIGTNRTKTLNNNITKVSHKNK